MSVRKETIKHQKQAEIENKSLIQRIKSYWPNLTINVRNLQEPTPSFVYKLYSLFFEEYEKRMSEIKTNYLKQEPEQFDPNLDELSLAIKLRQISLQLKVPFNLTDMFEPTPKRTHCFFSMFLNLLTFIKSDTEYIDELTEAAEKVNRFNEFYENKQCLLEEIKDMNLLHVKVEDNLKKLSHSINNLSEEHKEILRQKATREFEYQKYFKIKDKLVEDIRNSDEQVSRLREKCILLQEQIVEKAEIEQVQSKISTLRTEIENLDSDRSNIVSSLEEQEKENKHLNKCLELLLKSDFNEERLSRVETSLLSIVDINQEIKKWNEKINERNAELNNLQQVRINLIENISLLEKELVDLKKEAHDSNEQLVGHHNNLLEKIRSDLIVSRKYEDDISKIQSRIYNIKDDMSILKEGIKEEYSKLLEEQAIIYHAFNNALINIDNYIRDDGDTATYSL